MSDKALQVSGKVPAWGLWFVLMLVGLIPVIAPIFPILGRTSINAQVVRTGGLHEGRRGCTVTFLTPGGGVSARVENRCASGAQPGDWVTVYYDPDNPERVRVLSMELWIVGILPALIGGLGAFFARERTEFAGWRRVLWRDRFQVLNLFWHLRKDTAIAAKGVLTLRGLKGEQTIPNTDQAFDPGAVELSVQTAAELAEDEGAGLVFAYSYQRIGYVFGILPGRQMAFVKRIGPDWSYDAIPMQFVNGIRTEAGAWNRLRVEIEGSQAQFFVNGDRVSSMEYESVMGGGMVGIYGTFGERTIWRYADLVVLS